MKVTRTLLTIASLALAASSAHGQVVDIFGLRAGGDFDLFKVRTNGYVGINTEVPFAVLEVRQLGIGSERLMNVVSTGDQGQMINMERTTPFGFAGNDVLQLRIPDSVNGGQFIEAEIPGNVKFRVDADGDVRADGTIVGGGADYADLIEVSSGAASTVPGDLLVIDPNALRSVLVSSQPRSTLVAGIHSTAPGFLGSELDLDQIAKLLDPSDGEEARAAKTLAVAREIGMVPLAMAGIVPTKVSTENGPIQPGDLLVTSATPGHAMRDEEPRPGTIVGKALGALVEGTGVIPVLVTLG